MKTAFSMRDTNKMARGLFDIVKNAGAVDNGQGRPNCGYPPLRGCNHPQNMDGWGAIKGDGMVTEWRNLSQKAQHRVSFSLGAFASRNRIFENEKYVFKQETWRRFFFCFEAYSYLKTAHTFQEYALGRAG